MIYLDHNATTPLDSRVLEAMMPYLDTWYGNPSSLYKAGRITRGAIEVAREQVAALVRAHPSQVIFTSGGTEANNLAKKGVASNREAGIICIGATEHPSVNNPALALTTADWKIRTIPVDYCGQIDQTGLQPKPNDNFKLFSLMLANNETGVIQDIPQLTDAIRNDTTIIHTDAVQAAGKMPINFETLGVHLLSLSAHKIYGPKGIGALIFDKSTTLEPLIHGGGQEHGVRGGTENVAAIVGFGKAAELAVNELEDRQQHFAMHRAYLEEALEKYPGITIFGKQAKRLPNTLQIGIANTSGEMLLMELDRKGIAISSGSACSSESGKPSHVLMAMGVDENLARSAIRISLGIDNTRADIDQFLMVLGDLIPSQEL